MIIGDDPVTHVGDRKARQEGQEAIRATGASAPGDPVTTSGTVSK